MKYIDEFLEYLLVIKKHSDNTIRNYEADLKSFYDKDYTNKEQVKKLIEKLNNDERCV